MDLGRAGARAKGDALQCMPSLDPAGLPRGFRALPSWCLLWGGLRTQVEAVGEQEPPLWH